MLREKLKIGFRDRIGHEIYTMVINLKNLLYILDIRFVLAQPECWLRHFGQGFSCEFLRKNIKKYDTSPRTLSLREGSPKNSSWIKFHQIGACC